MFHKIQAFITSKTFRQIIDPSNIALYLFGAIILMVSWSGLRTIQVNYKLQQKISVLEQEVELQKLENDNFELKNKFYETDEYFDLSARRQFGRASPGEELYVVPKEVALSKVDPFKPAQPSTVSSSDQNANDPTYLKNIKAWRDFVLGQSNSSN
jgi:cell division protein FtsB